MSIGGLLSEVETEKEEEVEAEERRDGEEVVVWGGATRRVLSHIPQVAFVSRQPLSSRPGLPYPHSSSWVAARFLPGERSFEIQKREDD